MSYKTHKKLLGIFLLIVLCCSALLPVCTAAKMKNTTSTPIIDTEQPDNHQQCSDQKDDTDNKKHEENETPENNDDNEIDPEVKKWLKEFEEDKYRGWPVNFEEDDETGNQGEEGDRHSLRNRRDLDDLLNHPVFFGKPFVLPEFMPLLYKYIFYQLK